MERLNDSAEEAERMNICTQRNQTSPNVERRDITFTYDCGGYKHLQRRGLLFFFNFLPKNSNKL